MVSPVRQKVPVKCLPLLPTAAEVAKLACTKALLGNEVPVAANTLGIGLAALMSRSSESMSGERVVHVRDLHFRSPISADSLNVL